MAEFFHGIHHGQDIFRRDIVHHGVYRTNHATTSRTKNLHYTPYFLAHIRHAAER